jgi:hypothetical protein
VSLDTGHYYDNISNELQLEKLASPLVAARRAAGERLLNGKVANRRGSDQSALALTRAGISPTVAAG